MSTLLRNLSGLNKYLIATLDNHTTVASDNYTSLSEEVYLSLTSGLDQGAVPGYQVIKESVSLRPERTEEIGTNGGDRRGGD